MNVAAPAAGETNKPITPAVVPVKRAAQPSEAPRPDEAPVVQPEEHVVRGVD